MSFFKKIENIFKGMKNIFKKKYKVSFYYEHDSSGIYFEINDGRIISKDFNNINDAYDYIFHICDKYKGSIYIPDFVIIYDKNGKEFKKFDLYPLLDERNK